MTDTEKPLQLLNYDYYKAKLTNTDFNRLSEFVVKEYGIKLPPVKKTMLQSRLIRRLKDLKMSSFSEYVDYVFSHKGQIEEVIHMIDVISTNKTDFFREPIHFEYLLNEGLRELISKKNTSRINIWSAGCSSGEEPYTIAITLSEYLQNHPRFEYDIFASDISTLMLKHAINAIYKYEKIKNIPLTLKKKYFLKSKKAGESKVKLVPEIRNKVVFQRLNLKNESYLNLSMFDIIFCRNVLIYFDRPIQESILNKLCSKLKHGGILFLGHSESTTGFDLPIENIRPTIFKKI